MKPTTVFITGVSTGIGYGAAKELIQRGHTVFGSVRKKEDADRLQRELGASLIPLIMDVCDQRSIDEAVAQLTQKLAGKPLGGLINNSGVAVGGPLEILPIEDIINNFDVNVFGLLRVTKACLPLLKAGGGNPAGRILNMSSISGSMSLPYFGPYSGTKHALDGITKSLRVEMIRYGIEVIIIAPGPVVTPIWDKSSLDKFKGSAYYDSVVKFFTLFTGMGKAGMALDEFSRRLADIFETPKPKTKYVIMKGKLANFTLPSLLPDRMVDKELLKMI